MGAALAAALAGCGFSDGINEDFVVIDDALQDSITASTAMLDHKYAYLQKMACEEGRQWADSVNLQYEKASERLFALDEALTGPAVSDENVPKPFDDGGLATEALAEAQQLYALMASACPDDSVRAAIRSHGNTFTGLSDVRAWHSRDFHQAPPPTVTATIERWVADMGKAKRLCLGALLAPCR